MRRALLACLAGGAALDEQGIADERNLTVLDSNHVELVEQVLLCLVAACDYFCSCYRTRCLTGVGGDRRCHR